MNRLLAASFGCLNIAIIELLFFQFPGAKRALLIPYGIFLVILLVILAAQVLPQLVRLSIKSLRVFRVSSEVPLCLAVAALFVSGVYAPVSAVLVGSGLHYAETSVLVFLLLAFTDFLNLESLRALKNEAIFSIPALVKKARIINIDDPQELSVVPADQVKSRDRLRVEKGETIPADSLVVAGTADVCERRLTFSAGRKFKKAGDTVYAGSEIVKGSLTLQALASPSQSDLGACMDQVSAAISSHNFYFSKLAKIETIANIGCISAAFGAALFWLGAEAGFLAVSGVFITTLLVSLFSRVFPILWEMLRALSSATSRFGAYCSSIGSSFAKLAAVRNLVFDFVPAEPVGQYSLSSLSLLDERVSEKAVYSVLLGLFSRSDKAIHKDLCASVEKLCCDATADEVIQWNDLEESGVAGLVQGVRFLAGTEGALLSEGVRFEVGINLPGADGRDVFFLACGALPIARFFVEEPFYSDGPTLIKALEKAGVKTLLAGKAEADQLDKIGKKAGLELHAIAGGLDAGNFRDRVEGANPAALVTNSATTREAIEAAHVTFSFFDEREWNFKASDIVIFGRSLSPILPAINAAKSWQGTRKILANGSAALGAVTVVFAMARLIHPLALSCILAVWSVVEYALVLQILRRVSPQRLH